MQYIKQFKWLMQKRIKVIHSLIYRVICLHTNPNQVLNPIYRHLHLSLNCSPICAFTPYVAIKQLRPCGYDTQDYVISYFKQHIISSFNGFQLNMLPFGHVSH